MIHSARQVPIEHRTRSPRSCPTSHIPHPTSKSGLALPAAVFTLAIIALFIAGSAFATTQEARASVGALAERLALEAAEYGAAAVLRDWDPAWNVATPVGQTIGPIAHTLTGGASSEVRLTRMSYSTWWVVSRGTSGGLAGRRQAHRTVNAAFRLDLPPDAIDAALAVVDSVRVTGTGAVVGTDSVEALATCGASPAVIAGVAAPDTMRICSGTCGAPGSGIVGLPPLLPDTSIPARIAAITASISADIVMQPATIVTPGAIVNAGVCDTLVPTNWGDPAGGPCATHLPVIRALGDLTVRGGTGQGIIIAAGDVRFEQGATFAGLVVAQDDFVTGNGGGSVIGTVLAGDARRGNGDHTLVADDGMIRRSSCRLRRARLAAAPPVRIRERWWAEFD